MTRRRSIRSEVWENEVIWTRAQVLLDETGAALHPSDCHNWAVYAYDSDDDDPSTPVYSLSAQPPSDLVLTSYSTTSWDGESPGYNVTHGLASDAFARAGGRTYRIEYQINTTGEGPINLVHYAKTLPLWHV